MMTKTGPHHSILETIEDEELQLERHFHIQQVHKYVLGYIFILLLAIVVASVYSWQHTQVVELEQQVQSLSVQLEQMYR